MVYDIFFDWERDTKMKQVFREISKKGIEQEYDKDCVIEIKDKHIYIVTKGRVAYSWYSVDGRRQVFCFINGGGMFGELEYFEGKKSDMVAETSKKTRISILNEEIMEQILLEEPMIYRFILINVIRKKRILMSKLLDLSFSDSKGKVADTLIRFCYQDGIFIDNEKVEIRKRFTHEEIANMIGCSRVTVTKVLCDFEEEGLIYVRNNKIIVLNLEKLKEYVNWA